MSCHVRVPSQSDFSLSFTHTPNPSIRPFQTFRSLSHRLVFFRLGLFCFFFSLILFFTSAWVFEDALTSTPVLYYVPYRVIPTIPEAPTIDSDGTTGIHRFALVDTDTTDTFRIGIADDVFPFPGSLHLNEALKAIQWNLRHLSRANAVAVASIAPLLAVDTLQKYLVNILNDPGEPKYRKLRIASKHFQPIWELSPLRGLLLAAGFVERGGFCTLGYCDNNNNKPLPPHRIQEVALISYLLSEWQRTNENTSNNNNSNGSEGAGQHQQQQPQGSDGFGRAGFGRAGAMR
jgi:hypothetical protein